MKNSSKAIVGEVQVASTDSRVRRLIPYMSYYYPNNEHNFYPLEYLPTVSPHPPHSIESFRMHFHSTTTRRCVRSHHNRRSQTSRCFTAALNTRNRGPPSRPASFTKPARSRTSITRPSNRRCSRATTATATSRPSRSSVRKPSTRTFSRRSWTPTSCRASSSRFLRPKICRTRSTRRSGRIECTAPTARCTNELSPLAATHSAHRTASTSQ